MVFDQLFTENKKDHLIRPRVSALLANAVKHPLSIVCAGAGCGKTRAVFDFTREVSSPSVWMHFSERDNASSRFWFKYTQIIASGNKMFVEHCKNLGFPNTEEKINEHLSIRRQYAPGKPRLIILDDVHLIDQPDLLFFLQRGLLDIAKNTSIVLICRKLPNIDLSGLYLRGLIPMITEEDLNFTEDELALFLRQQDQLVSRLNQAQIMEDTNGWAFSVSLAVRSLRNSPGYAGYVRVAMKQNIFKLMETEVFNFISKPLRRFLIRLSLIDHLSADLIDDLAQGNTTLISELKRQSAYIRFDNYTNAYLIHQLFLEYLRSHEKSLSHEEVTQTYRIAAEWCARNSFEVDALSYWEKTGGYSAIVSLLLNLPVQMTPDIAYCAAEIFERAPRKLSVQIDFFAVMHVRVVIRLGRWTEALSLMRQYEDQLLRLPENDLFRNRALGVIYYSWGQIRALMSTSDNCYDFDVYYAKMNQCLMKAPIEPDHYADLPIGFWASMVGSAQPGAPQAYIEAVNRTVNQIASCWGGGATGIASLCQGELLFYQGDLKAAELLIIDALRQAQEAGQFEVVHKSLFYLLRIALCQGRYKRATQILHEIQNGLSYESGCSHRISQCDAALGWYLCILRQPEKLPTWMKENFAAYSHAYFIENLGNQIKARYCYLTGNYPLLLSYVKNMRHRESILYGRVEMLVLQACAYLQMKDRSASLLALQEAYEAASPNDILTPFIELGKDMRTLASAAQREPDCKLPSEWLELVKRKSASFAKHQSVMLASHDKAHGNGRRAVLSARENEIMTDLYHGLSRLEIASKHTLSINTVNSAINNIFGKLGARNVVDAVRIAAEEKLVQ